MPVSRAFFAFRLTALALFGLAAAPAAAVDKLISTPAEKFITAPGGVDLRSGRFAYEETDLAIGGEGNSGLSLARTLTATVPGHSNPFGNLSHNWDIMVSERKFSIDNPESSSGPDFQIFVHFGGRSMTYDVAHAVGRARPGRRHRKRQFGAVRIGMDVDIDDRLCRAGGRARLKQQGHG